MRRRFRRCSNEPCRNRKAQVGPRTDALLPFEKSELADTGGKRAVSSVRVATSEDIPQLVALMTDFYAEADYPLAAAAAARTFAQLLGDPKLGGVWILEDDSTAAGYVVLTVRMRRRNTSIGESVLRRVGECSSRCRSHRQSTPSSVGWRSSNGRRLRIDNSNPRPSAAAVP
jgi:hypothetical protein